MSKSRIALISESASTHSGARAPIDIAQHLSKTGHKVTLYAYDHQKDRNVIKNLKKNGVAAVLITTPKIPLVSKYLTIFNLTQKLKANKPDVVLFIGTLPFFLAAKLTRIPIIRIYMGSQLDAYLEKTLFQKITFLDKLLNLVAKYYIFTSNLLTYHLSDKVVAISAYAAREGRKLYGRKADKIIYLGSDLKPTTHYSLPTTHYPLTILSVSRITPYKGFHLIIDAIKKIKTTKKIIFTIIGSQPKKNYLDYLEKIGADLVNIIIDPDDKTLAQNYQKCDFYVTADKNLYFGLPICEAAKFAKPTISLDYGAARELIIHGKTGYIAKNQHELTNHIDKLIKNPKLTKKLGEEAKKYTSKKFSWKKIVKDYNDLIQKIT